MMGAMVIKQSILVLFSNLFKPFWICGKSRKDKLRNEQICETIADKIRKNCLRWFWYKHRRQVSAPIVKCEVDITMLEVWKKIWMSLTSHDLALDGIAERDSWSRPKWLGLRVELRWGDHDSLQNGLSKLDRNTIISSEQSEMWLTWAKDWWWLNGVILKELALVH